MRDCLGDGIYTIRFVRRRTATSMGGAFVSGQVPQLISGAWARAFGQSKASALVQILPGCGEVLTELLDLAVLEIELWRQTDAGQALVWAGPVEDLVDNRDGTATVTAADSSLYVLDERVAQPGTWTQVDLATIFVDVLRAALALDDPGMILQASPTGILGDRVIADTDVIGVRQVLEELSRTAIDWTVVGREWRIGGTEVDMSRVLPVRLRDEDFGTPPKIRVSRSAMGTEYVTRGSSGIVGRAGGARADGVHIQRIVEGSQILDIPSANAAAQTAWDIGHEPYVMIDGTPEASLSPMTRCDIQTLVPGMGVPVEVGDSLRYRGTMRLSQVNVSFDRERENVSLTLQPVGTGSL